MTEILFPQLLHRFFHYWLVEQRNASQLTVISYRDTWRLFLRHVAALHIKALVDALPRAGQIGDHEALVDPVAVDFNLGHDPPRP